MPFSFGEKLKIIMGRRKVTITDLAKKTGQSPQNLANKFQRDNFSETELKKLTAALNCTFETVFTMTDNGEKI